MKKLLCQSQDAALAQPCQHIGKVLPAYWQRLANPLARGCQWVGRKW
ncbi:hypothetical protein [Bacteroides sp.]|nr:hypothetical protein [Bacteroides sp.]MDE5710889.1 hypothetical protein [Bacteroides sp.]MDE5761197.1 hypothetical protein [Bacteroides sp.]MDE6215011.1 hypothetical protein [Bacteroides sp.]MDE6349023.1 hypothetical protein [Bacteroides sp.]